MKEHHKKAAGGGSKDGGKKESEKEKKHAAGLKHGSIKHVKKNKKEQRSNTPTEIEEVKAALRLAVSKS